MKFISKPKHVEAEGGKHVLALPAAPPQEKP